MLMVQKFGGTSLATAELLRRAAGKIGELMAQGHSVVTVVSAQGDRTDELLEEARTLSGTPNRRELDALLATGEQCAAAKLAIVAQSMGIQAVSLSGWQAGIHTDGTPGNARILSIDPKTVLQILSQGEAVIVCGFQGVDPEGNVTTLGRGGSDTTAVALAAALHADHCRIYTDVDGVYDRDPRKHPDARRYDRIDYSTMLTMARNGAQVLHPRCVALAQEHKIPIEVLSALEDHPGTMVMEKV